MQTGTLLEKGRLAERDLPTVFPTYIKGVIVRFDFDALELRNFKLKVKSKATGAPYMVYIVYMPLAGGSLGLWPMVVHICIDVGLSSLLVSTFWALRRP